MRGVASDATAARDRAVWNLYEDWCVAVDRDPLPAGPDTLAAFLAAHPAAQGTQRRRVSVVNAVHRVAGHEEPGRAEAVRRAIDGRRAERLAERADTAARAIARLPDSGWPTLLFARRDAMLLTLATTGMSFHAIARLTCGQVDVTDIGGLRIRSDAETVMTPRRLPVLGVHPARIYEDWARIRALQHHLPSDRVLAAYLVGDPTPRVPPPPSQLPLLTPLDLWGAAPLAPTPLTGPAAAAIVRAHLAGVAAPHPPRAPHRPGLSTVEESSAPVAATRPLDPRSYGHGVDARRSALAALVDVPDVLDAVEDKAEKLLADLAAILDTVGPEREGST